MRTQWLTLQPDGAAYLPDHPGVRSLWRGTPDRVRVPEGLGPSTAMIIEHRSERCPCGGEHESGIWILDADDLRVARCEVGRVFLWYREVTP